MHSAGLGSPDRTQPVLWRARWTDKTPDQFREPTYRRTPVAVWQGPTSLRPGEPATSTCLAKSRTVGGYGSLSQGY